MKLCLLFHCICESYDEVPQRGRELFVSQSDLRVLAEQLLDRGYTFSALENPAPDTVTFTFDDGYYNNLLFSELSRAHDIPYLIFLPAYYVKSGDRFPWFQEDGVDYEEIQNFDYYAYYSGLSSAGTVDGASSMTRPMTFQELKDLKVSDQVEYGCHGYYHQPLSKMYEKYFRQEQDLSLSVLKDNLGIVSRYFGLANGRYTKWVMGELLKTFEVVFTIEGRPFHHGDKVVHRLSLTNPNVSRPLIQQIDQHLGVLRQAKRAVRTFRRLQI